MATFPHKAPKPPVAFENGSGMDHSKPKAIKPSGDTTSGTAPASGNPPQSGTSPKAFSGTRSKDFSGTTYKVGSGMIKVSRIFFK
jgi:hypothetical protein